MPAAKSGSGNGKWTSTVTVLALLAVFPGAFWSGGPNLRGKALAFEASMQAPARFVKVKVMKSGDILYNGRRVWLEQLDQEFRKLKSEGGGVEYDREGAEKEPEGKQAEAVKAVLDKIIQYRLAVKVAQPPPARKK